MKQKGDGVSRVQLPVIGAPSGSASHSVDFDGLRAFLQGTVSGEVRFDRLSRALYATDASVYQIVPLGVVLPRTPEDIVAVVRACRQFSVPLTARGGGTSQAGQAIGPGLVLDCSKYLDRILEINEVERWVRVQPGCVLDDLNLAVKSFGLQFAPDVSTSNRATIGGMIANNSSGAHSLIYGKTVDHVIELRVVLADGSIVNCSPLTEDERCGKSKQPGLEGDCYRMVQHLASVHAAEIETRYPKILRRVGGYNLDLFRGPNPFNLSQLLVGSEGTLAVTLEAKLRLIELPGAKALLVVQFHDLLEALAATPDILAQQPAAVEVVDQHVLSSTRTNPEAVRLRDFLQGDPAAILLIEFYGDRSADLLPRLDALASELERKGSGYHVHRATDPAEQARIWKLRKMALGLSMAQKGDAKAISFVEDTAVAPERLRDYIAEFLALVARHGTTAGVYAHASVGCLHVRPVINLKTEEGIRKFERIAQEVADLVLKYGGALSGEHGDGLVRSPFQEKMFGPVLYQAFRELKRTFDPHNLLNPGKIVDAPPLATNLRYGANYVTPDVPTTFDFSVDGGIVRSAELCSGVGACRKKREGSMCPSYQATCDEQHTTRGRANTLRLAMTGQLGMQGLTDPAVHEALDLCLECKACKSECPTNVDMARLKAEFLHQFYRKHGLPWRNRLFGHVARISRWGCRLSPVSNWIGQWRLGSWLNQILLGIDRRRLPPAFAGTSFLQKHRRRTVLHDPDAKRSVVLLADTFTNFHEPNVGHATVELLERIGCSVAVAQLGRDWCCGRPMISNGMLEQAVALAGRTVDLLSRPPYENMPIIACEPSCILTIKDDYPALVRGESRHRALTLAARCWTVEEFLESIIQERPLQEIFTPSPGKIYVQGHCHQRSLVGMEPALRLLRRIPGAKVVDLDAGCCGMAGSFGYEQEHYEISRQVGESRLFPALRRIEKDAVVVAPGFSCRMQIKHFTGKTALHPAELLQARLSKPC